MNLNLIKKDLLEIYRSKKFLILMIVFLFIALSSPAFAKLMPEIFKSLQVQGITITMPDPTAADSIDQFLKNIGQIGLVVIIFVVAGSVVEEKTRKNLEILLTKPISRNNFIISKFVSYFLAVIVTYVIAAIIFFAYTASIFTAPDLGRFACLASILLIYILMIVAITILGSTISKNSILAAGFGFIFFIIFGTVLGLISSIAPYSPGYIFEHYKDLMANGWGNDFVAPLVVSIILIIVSLVTSLLVFKDQEIER